MQQPSPSTQKNNTHKSFMEEQEFYGILTPKVCDPATSFNCLVSSGRFEKGITHVADTLPESANCKQRTETWDWNDWILDRYWSPEDGVSEYVADDTTTTSNNNPDSQSQQLTYGEVTALGVRQLAHAMGIVDCENQASSVGEADNNDESDIVFYDMGSGVGRLVIQMYIDQPDRVTKAVGIELAEDRHRIGERALEMILSEEQHMSENFYSPYEDGIDTAADTRSAQTTTEEDDAFPVQLIHGDVLDVPIDPRTSHVYISSLCFPENVLLQLQEKLLRLPNIRVVVALNRLDLINQLVGRELWEERDVFIQMSWGDSKAKIYRKIV